MSQHDRCPFVSRGHKGQLAPRCLALGTMIKESYHGCRRHLARDFSPPLLGSFRRDAPAISRVCSPNNGKVGNQVLCPHSRSFGSYFDVIFWCIQCLLAFFSSQPHPHQSSSSTQFSQEWARRKVVVKHSIKSKINGHCDERTPSIQ